MTDTGKFSLPASVPGANPASIGWVYIGNEPMTFSDVVDLAKALSDMWDGDVDPKNLLVDPFSTGGRYSKRYTTYYNLMTGTQADGGLGTDVYETQYTGDGVQFAKEDIWYINCDGDMVKGLPGNAGEHHMVYVGGGYEDAVEGPEPGSQAESLLGSGTYAWDDEEKLYVIR